MRVSIARVDEKTAQSANGAKIEVDLLTAQILGVKYANPSWSNQKVGQELGISKETVRQRLIRFEESDAVKDAIARVGGLIPKAYRVYEDILDGDDGDASERLSAARDVMRGTGVFIEKSEQARRNIATSPADVFNAMQQWTDAEHDQFRELWIGSESGDNESAQTDAGVVAGSEPSPDASGRAA